jgi:Xaa-Pro aminopeptidase
MQSVDATPLLARLRITKDRYELAAMVEAVRMIETALRNTIVQIRPGITERQLAAIWKHEIMATGAEGESFDCMVASGPNSANPHHHNSDRAFQVGDMIILDGGAIAEGYASDITRTVALGTPNATARHIYSLVQEANAAGRRAVRPGTTGEAIDTATREVIAGGGYGDYFVHRTGHGLGMECHEQPNIVAGSTQPLDIGTTFTIEPGIYIPGVAGVRIEDDIVITENGGKSLTTFDRELLVLPT